MQMLKFQNIELGKGRAGLLSYIMYDGIVRSEWMVKLFIHCD